VIEGLTEIGQVSWKTDQSPAKMTVKLFVELFWKVRPLQLKDILNDIGPKLFSRIVVSKTKQSAQRQLKGTSSSSNTLLD